MIGPRLSPLNRFNNVIGPGQTDGMSYVLACAWLWSWHSGLIYDLTLICCQIALQWRCWFCVYLHRTVGLVWTARTLLALLCFVLTYTYGACDLSQSHPHCPPKYTTMPMTGLLLSSSNPWKNGVRCGRADWTCLPAVPLGWCSCYWIEQRTSACTCAWLWRTFGSSVEYAIIISSWFHVQIHYNGDDGCGAVQTHYNGDDGCAFIFVACMGRCRVGPGRTACTSVLACLNLKQVVIDVRCSMRS